MDLREMLPYLLPGAVAWVEAQAARVAQVGTPLNDTGQRVARAVGVRQPERIRVEIVDQFPLPDDERLRHVAENIGFLGPDTIGITFGHAVLIRQGHESVRLYSHELRHVQQYEAFGSIGAFLQEYLQQVVDVGYRQAPLEQDAREHELLEV